MPDVLGYRKLFGVIGPSTNTVVQPDFEAMRVPGVTNHYSRIFVTDPVALSDAADLRPLIAPRVEQLELFAA